VDIPNHTEDKTAEILPRALTSGNTHSAPVHQIHTNDRKRVAHPWVCQIIQKAKRERNYHELRNPKMLTQSQNNWKRVVVKGKNI